MSAQEKYIALTQTKGKADPSTLYAIFDQLDPIKPEQLLGEWSGGFFDTGHPIANTLNEIKWVEKVFKTVDLVDPVIVERDGKRVSWGQWGIASLKEMVHRGKVSTTMIYDDRPVFDHFRSVNDNLVAGIMEGRELAKDGDFFFYLKR
ncbi:hypothetical protein ASPWEDRAFT_44057 [Aspergillus wentii DTO 134E9]|uniref:GXWXG domain-containing protein n=1 Tax=Aspergillus wentii DTO 134E9 TaxID=1073089 RepID=A0A1L9RAT7_ASPWE|nr:uncharacterized protein ASPWEDRAFT_44057 [Aspergillus wentii DTO 134E9]KAI9934614.1 hypothetical protein MW887_000230 [Aspergillus wentii]OJJ32035.1 hypothetical protein ASPWEDRAFT_44057 [Aspergillus wentii DTO 134E9]